MPKVPETKVEELENGWFRAISFQGARPYKMSWDSAEINYEVKNIVEAPTKARAIKLAEM